MSCPLVHGSRSLEHITVFQNVSNLFINLQRITSQGPGRRKTLLRESKNLALKLISFKQKKTTFLLITFISLRQNSIIFHFLLQQSSTSS